MVIVGNGNGNGNGINKKIESISAKIVIAVIGAS